MVANEGKPSKKPGGRRHRHSNARISVTPQVETPVLFVHPAKQGIAFRPDENMGRPYGIFPLGLPALVNMLRANGIGVKGINHSLELQLDSSFDLSRWLAAQRGVKVVLIDLHWYEHCYGAISTARLCRQAYPDAWIILGGLSASGFAREILENFSEVDFILRGDAEQPLLQLTRLLLDANTAEELLAALAQVPNLAYRDATGVVENAITYVACPADLDRLNFVDVDFMEHWQEYLVHEYIVTDLAAARQALQSPASAMKGRWLCTARGCKYNCSYCGGGKNAHKKLANRPGLVVRSPEAVVSELARLKDLGIVQGSMSWDIADMGEDYWQEFFALLSKSGLKTGIYNEFFQMPEASFVEAFARHVDKAHSCLALSPLTGNERVRRLNGKHFSNEELFDILEVMSRHKLYLFVYFSLNLPGETRETFQETLELAREIYDFYPHSLLKILNTNHTIDPLAPMNVDAEKFGVVSTMKTFMDYYHYCRSTQYSIPAARTEAHRGYHLIDLNARSIEAMANAWDQVREGKEVSWWPVPPSW